MTDEQKNPVPPRNLSPRETVLISMGARCGRCGYKDHLAALTVRVEGLTQNRKATNYAQYWLSVLGIATMDPGRIEVICRNCLAIEQEEQREAVAPSTAPTVYVYCTDLLSDQINKRQQWLDVLEEPKKVYIVTGEDKIWEYIGNTKKGSSWKVVDVTAKDILKYITADLSLANNGLFKIVNDKLEPVS